MSDLKPDFWLATMQEAQQLRRNFHKHPELGWEEWRTAETIRAKLSAWHIPWRHCADTGTVATIGEGRHNIALRGDMDALPIQELNQLDYRSSHDGCMHACGHDGHTATLLASARWLKSQEQNLSNKITLLFQPAEEGGFGAKKMIDDGALEGVNEIFGWHNWPAIPFGELLCPDGIVMCGNGTFQIVVKGEGGHASQPELCRDPVLAASAMVLALQQVTSRRLAPQEPAVLSVTSFDAPSGPTTIPEQAILGGSIRVPNENVRKKMNVLIQEICSSVASSYGVLAEVKITNRYPATINHAAQAARVRDEWSLAQQGNTLANNTATPIMASEDFSFYLQEIPGAFALVGAHEGDAHRVPCHSAHYDFNDELIPRVTELYARLAGLRQRD